MVFAVFALRSLGEGGPGTDIIEHYECRGTRLIESRKQVKVHEVLLRVLARSRYKLIQNCLGSRSISKNRDELMNYTVRVMLLWYYVKVLVQRVIMFLVGIQSPDNLAY